MTGFDFPWAVLPGEFVNDDGLATHPAGGVNSALYAVDLALRRLDQQPPVHSLGNVQKLMRHNFGSIADASRCRDGHLKLLWWPCAETRFLRAKHGARNRNPDWLAGQINDHRQRPALARREQPCRHIPRHQSHDFCLARAGIYGRYFNHHEPSSFDVQHNGRN